MKGCKYTDVYIKRSRRKYVMCIIKVREEAKIRNRNKQVPHLTKANVWESKKKTTTQEHITFKRANRLALSQEVSQGCKKQTWQYGKDRHKTVCTFGELHDYLKLKWCVISKLSFVKVMFSHFNGYSY